MPVSLHDQIASTGFSILRANEGVNPLYLQFALRLPSTLEQFRKWSTGSSYPAILDSDVAKTLIPVPDEQRQDEIAARVFEALRKRHEAVALARLELNQELDSITAELAGHEIPDTPLEPDEIPLEFRTAADSFTLVSSLPALTTDRNGIGDTEVQEQLSLED